MLPEKGDVTIAHKTINLTGELSTAEKAVAGCIIEHVNRTTGRCDPGIDRIAMLTGLHRRTVIRAVDRLYRLSFIEKERHGSRALRNRYLPNWPLFREREAEWRRRFNGSGSEATGPNGNRAPVPRMSPERCQICPAAGDAPVTQTSTRNLPKEPSADTVAPGAGQAGPVVSGFRGLGGRRFTGRASTTASGEAARTAAEKRWWSELHNRYVGDAEAYGLIVDAIDTSIQEAATTAELKQRGSGLCTVLRLIDQRQHLRPALPPSGTTP